MKISKELLTRVSELDLKTKRSVTSLLAGSTRSAFRGSGMQFKEFRHYEPGDDIRHMAWQVTARTGRPTIKTYEEERELNIQILVDVSGSSLFGTQMNQLRKDMYAELVAVLGLAAVKSKDKVGLHYFTDKVSQSLPSRNTRHHILKAVSIVLEQPYLLKRSDLSQPLELLQTLLKKRTLILLLSDFQVPPFEKALQVLTKRHEVVLLHCCDDGERGLIPKGLVEAMDPETGEFFMLDTQSRHLRKEMADTQMERQSYLEQMCQNLGCDYLCLSRQDDYLMRLVHFFHRRGPGRL